LKAGEDTLTLNEMLEVIKAIFVDFDFYRFIGTFGGLMKLVAKIAGLFAA
jgi:hypothetical protein